MVVTYSHFRFLTLSNLHNISASDVNYLESQGCLHVPTRPVLDDFVEQYFLHVHPMAPIIDEGNFWDMYAQNLTDKGEIRLDTVSLVLFQAMLFSSCTHARCLGADKLAARPDASTKGQGSLRRLWWCCIIADRIMSLSARCRLLISHSTFNFGSSTALQASDLQDEVHRSSVYNPVSKKSLNCLLGVSTDFMVMLTDVLEITFPLRDLSVAKKNMDFEEPITIAKCESAMNRWFSHASMIFPPFEQPNSYTERRPTLHKSVGLHIGILYIYYHHARIALQHCKLSSYLRSATDQTVEPTALLEIRDNLQDAIASMSQLFSNLNRLRIVRWLPVSAIGCMAIPLALSVVTAKLGTTNAPSSPIHSSGTGSDNHSLIAFTEALSSFYPQYDDVELIKAAVRQAADQVETVSQTHDMWALSSTWTEILLNNPSSYLRIVLLIDICINKGRVADDQDLPEWLLCRDKVNSPGAFLDTLQETTLQGFSPTLGGLLLSQMAELGE
ncbi:cutinase transcription factor 1 beta [Fusarium tjaetaba]|uniref:Cutinase transcription factor 1 beta n=1 Tax=Fusarium tjaetaba TaxID=1567544 RepID=A0A8H5S9J8_9HYPO|nr:cutinase transcription factor 1 beta [Fusarium tjaetaba]KAF5646979.1 cutinase transcription factor 1 beta [Fusarium tjaetaba]